MAADLRVSHPVAGPPVAGPPVAVEIRVRGCVQGVGFRPTVWRIARELGLDGEVFNDGEGVLIRARGTAPRLDALIERIEREPPPLAQIERIEIGEFAGGLPAGFHIAASGQGATHTRMSPDAAICPACAAEVLDPGERRYRYPFTNCTHCGPRLTIALGIPFDRIRTTMAPFALCAACLAEYHDPADRRFHAQAIACPDCGPRAVLCRIDAGIACEIPGEIRAGEATLAAARLIRAGEIVALKGLGGYHLACDATDAAAVARLRRLKHRDAKPFALMARDLAMIRRYCTIAPEEERALSGAAAPIVVLRAGGPERLPEAVAPGLSTLGFMLPTTPLHLLAMAGLEGPAVMTSGNRSDEPQVTDDAEMPARLGSIAAYALMHERGIANRVDDSVVRAMAGRVRLLRRARGYAPAPVALPPGFATAPDILAMGGELKATFCMVTDGQAILSQHQGDLEHPAAFDDYRRNLALYRELFDQRPAALAADLHPEYLSAKLAREMACAGGLPLIEVQHHHAHIAACLAENGRPLAAPAVLGIALDGLGWGDDGTLWGGEFLLGDYRGYRRLACFAPVAMPGGASAIREPWRSLYAHLARSIGWAELTGSFGGLELCDDLSAKPLTTIDAMIARGLNSPPASSCGRLFDAVAAAIGICRECQAYEGEAAMRLEAIVDAAALGGAGGYPFAIMRDAGLVTLEPRPMWQALLRDLAADMPAPVIAARFHRGLAAAIAAMARALAQRGARFDTVALSGGCFQNRILFEQTVLGLEALGFSVLGHAQVPANDGGLALGQAAIAAARLQERTPSCV
ncbi:MAG TPA: carbamoyltransferase HypF [Stellaceae bacterium]|jgi:hydrogenase maturation protein HypF|nr:carbamoyltransferase HypF [Stellaceae bacterium]